MAIELRDQFALAALKVVRVKGCTADQISKAAYKFADAMLQARVVGMPDLYMFGGGVRRKSLKPKATDAQVPLILKMKKRGLTHKQIADKLQINGQSVNGVVAVYKRKIWTFVGKKKLRRKRK